MVHRSSFLRVLAFLIVCLLLPTSIVAAQDAGTDDSFVLQVNRPVTVAQDDRVDSLIVIDDDAIVDGHVRDALLVVNGTATINGTVDGDVVVISGALHLGDSAVVDNVTLFSSSLDRAEGATVTGDLVEEADVTSFGWGMTIFSVMLWVGWTIAMLIAAILFVALAWPTLEGATETLTTRPLESGVTGLATMVILPIAAVVAFVTLIGIPVGLAIVLVVIPLLGPMGFLVSAQRLGTWVAEATNLRVGRFLPIIIGMVILQLFGWIPLIGGLFIFLAMMLGTGALIYRFWKDRRATRAATSTVAPMGGPAHA